MTGQSHIRLLPLDVANKIAAGEVVERPASVLKELLENAIDAGAAHIAVAAVAGGTRLVSVADDGGGMSRDDALLSIERHATSKIRDVADIERIQTLGFRGEALAAISSVSRFRLQTCERGAAAGTELAVSGGKLQDVREVGCPPGTVVEVRDLFFNVPARRKFLRSAQTETAHLRQTFLVHALAHPEIGLRLTIDGREAGRAAAGATLPERVRELFGEDYLRRLVPVDYHAGGLTVRGFISQPAFNRADTGEQFIFVNGRPAGAPLLHRALREGYHTLLPNDRHPVLLLLLELDPGEVDVNVHPTKKEVRFRRANDVRDGVIAALRQTLAQGRQPGAAAAPPPEGTPPAAPAQKPLLQIDNLPPTRAFQYPRLPMVPAGVAPPERRSPVPPPPSASAGAAPAVPTGAAPATARGPSPWAWCRVVGQIGGLYVLLETEDGFVIMDPHAAHERVMFERFMQQYAGGHLATQGLLVPESVELLPHDALLVRRNLDLLRKMGFGVAEFGGDTLVVDALPAFFSGLSARMLLADIARQLEEAGARGGKDKAREEAVAQAACKAAVKAHDRLSLAEIEQLVIDLASTEMPYTCPHGRPTLIYTAFQELHRKFGRE